MIWFIKTGDAVSEDFPFRKSYRYTSPVGTKRPRSYSLSIYADETSPTAPIGRSSNVKLLCRLSADLVSIKPFHSRLLVLYPFQMTDGDMLYVDLTMSHLGRFSNADFIRARYQMSN